ncbi:hypothetical protein KC318_g17952, partial [Hortaea werneckii]
MGSNSSQPAYPTQTDAALSAPPTQHGDSHMQSSQQTNGQPEISETPSADPHSGGEIHVASPRSKVAIPRTKRLVTEMESADGDTGAKSRSRKRARKSSEGQKARGRPRDPSQLTRTQPQQPEAQQAEANGVSQVPQVPKNKKRKLSKADRHAQELAERFIANGEAHGPNDTVNETTTSQAEQGKSTRQRRKFDDSEPIRDGGANLSSEAPAEEQGQDNEGKEAEKAPRSKRKKRAAQPAATEADKQETKNSPGQKPQRKISKRGDATNETTRRSDDNDIRTGSKSPEVPESQPVDAGENQNVPDPESQQHKGGLPVSPKGKAGPQKRKKRKSAAGEAPPVASEDGPSSEPRTGKATKAARKEQADAGTRAKANRNIGKTPRQRSQQPTPSKSPSELDGRDQDRDAAAPEDHNGGASSKRDAQDPPTYDMDATDHVTNWLSSQQEASTDAQASGSGKHSPNGGHRNGQRDSAPGQSGEEEHQSTSIHRAQTSKRQPRAKPGDSDVSMASLPAPVVNGPAAGAFDSSEKAA